ncbi:MULTISPECIES: outer membrane protein [Pseudovibrio]|uniref:outer membrane protein n=1 Tax=Stappiaceae TaxID=2821832 RepID=UPI00236542B9|nr:MULTISPECIES: outer membrane protein [Pseudovibrio]MDD7909738.1 porin family protein [Pseudovibrio exalbescens]MDX5592080.1 outer membrane protein [Pseudovibrio sp. SPO723]
MYRVFVSASAIMACALLASNAQAQQVIEDIGIEEEQEIAETEIFLEPLLYDWSGAYVGASAGYAHLRGQDRFDSSSGYDGAVGGLYAGYNYVYQDVFIGAEIEGNLWGFSGHSSSGLDLDSDYLLAAKVRAGIIWEYILAYVDAGVATSRISAENPNFGGGSDSNQMTGWMVGGGVEAMVADNLSLRLDYQHIDFGSDTFRIGSTSFSEDVTSDIVRIGITYHFETF